MCIDPGTLTVITTLASTAVGIGGTVMQANAQAQASEYEARIAERNAEIADNNARDARLRGDAEVQKKSLETRALLGRQRALFADRNISSASGTALEVLGDTAQFGKLDALTIRNNFEREAVGYENQSGGFSAQAQMSQMAAKNAGVSGVLGAVGQGIGGLSSVYKYRSQRRLGLA